MKGLKKTKKVSKNKDTETVLRSNGRMIIIAESRNLQEQDVLKNPLGPSSCFPGLHNDFPHKTNKAQLGKELEKLIQPTENVARPSAYLPKA